MKISKKQNVKANTDPFNQELVVIEEAPIETPDACCCKYQCAIDLISAAIESLAEVARDDEIAKDSIANLGVVMLDLKGGCE